MKRKAFQNSLVVAVLALTFGLSTAVLVTSCQKQDYEDEPASPQNSKTKAELPYLEFTTGHIGEGRSSQENKQVIGLALERVKLSKTDGLWQMNINSAAEINVSPEVFGFLNQIIENSNADILPNLAKMSIAPRLKKPGDLDPDDEPVRNDCVASCFGWIHNNMGFGPTYNSSNSWINNQFGGGVPSNQMESTLKHFYGPNNVSSFPVNSQNGMYNSTNSTVIVNYKVDTSGHAVIYQGTFGDAILVLDPQFDNMDRVIDTTNVISSFKVTK